ncbi:MAG: hypothetical protein L3J23_05920 [Flavobacteriaceae bacterium]|nr:hypothetical protein [Flavobacteriaceae bacterium]
MTKWNFGNDIVKEEKVITFFKYNPIDVKRTYGVLLIFQNEKQNKLQIHFEIEIICLKKIGRFYIFEINKKQVYVNEKKPNTTIDELVEKCGNVLYPLQIKVNSIGLVTTIINHKAIQNRWVIVQQKIKQAYKGKEVNLLLKNMNATLQDTDKTTLFLQRDWFMSLFFTSIYQNNKKDIKYFPFIPYTSGVAYEIKQIYKNYTHKKGTMIIEQKGECIDTRSESDILQGNLILVNKGEIVKGISDLKYHIHKNSSIVDAIIGSCQIDFPSGKNKKVIIEIYNLKEKTPKTETERNEEQEELEKKIPQPKKQKKKYFSFWKK